MPTRCEHYRLCQAWVWGCAAFCTQSRKRVRLNWPIGQIAVLILHTSLPLIDTLTKLDIMSVTLLHLQERKGASSQVGIKCLLTGFYCIQQNRLKMSTRCEHYRLCQAWVWGRVAFCTQSRKRVRLNWPIGQIAVFILQTILLIIEALTKLTIMSVTLLFLQERASYFKYYCTFLQGMILIA